MKLLKRFLLIAGAIATIQCVLSTGLVEVHPMVAVGLSVLAASLIPLLTKDET